MREYLSSRSAKLARNCAKLHQLHCAQNSSTHYKNHQQASAREIYILCAMCANTYIKFIQKKNKFRIYTLLVLINMRAKITQVQQNMLSMKLRGIIKNYETYSEKIRTHSKRNCAKII